MAPLAPPGHAYVYASFVSLILQAVGLTLIMLLK